tara:strand:- start:282 stop:518 length:237 start_codon:yes stop_codon:yes gene_type:complete
LTHAPYTTFLFVENKSSRHSSGYTLNICVDKIICANKKTIYSGAVKKKNTTAGGMTAYSTLYVKYPQSFICASLNDYI